MTLSQFLTTLGTFQERIPLDQLQQLLQEASISLADVRDQIIFRSEKYQRNLLQAGPQYYALVLCWQTGQASPIHDHQGASCGVKVLQGAATETRFERHADGRLISIRTTCFSPGMVCGSVDADIHQICNTGTENLVTLHVYSPFLNNVHVYSQDSSEVQLFIDPLVEQHQRQQR